MKNLIVLIFNESVLFNTVLNPISKPLLTAQLLMQLPCVHGLLAVMLNNFYNFNTSFSIVKEL